jgi:hypothetical protein
MKNILTDNPSDCRICRMANAQQPNAEFDPELAKELGADDYGMKSYVL